MNGPLNGPAGLVTWSVLDGSAPTVSGVSTSAVDRCVPSTSVIASGTVPSGAYVPACACVLCST